MTSPKALFVKTKDHYSKRNRSFIVTLFVFFLMSVWTAWFFPTYRFIQQQQQQQQQQEIVVDSSTQMGSSNNNEKICFVNSVYGHNREGAAMDKVTNVTEFRRSSALSSVHNVDYEFYYFTNILELHTPGWTKVILKIQNVSRHITMSRYPKFMGWQYPPIQQNCGLVVYLDGYWSPVMHKQLKFSLLMHQVQNHKYGLVQVLHPFRNGIKAEMDRIVSGTKDTQEHVDLSLKWMESQPDFDDNCTLYWNGVFAYDPTNPWFQKASTYFWKRFSMEVDSWRDQPLWAYTLHHFGIEPIVLEEKRLKFYVKEILDNKGDHHYNESTVTTTKK